MAEKEFVFKINGEQAANTIAGIQKQIKALDDTIANTNIKDPGFSDLVKESEKAKSSLKTLQTEGIGGLKPQGIMGQLKGFGKTLGEIPGPIGGVIGGINSMTAASLRFIATPIGAIIAALVVVFKAFQKGIESSEKAQMGLNKIMGAFTGIIGPVIKSIGEFAAFLIDGVVVAIDAVVSALAALGVDFAENAKAGMALADSLNQIEEAEGDLQVARAEQNKTLAEAKELLSDTNATYAQRKRALDEIRASEEKLAAQEVDLARKQVAAAKENIRLYGESADANDKLDQSRIKLANTEESFAAKKRQFNKEDKKLIAEAAATQKQADADAEARRKEAAANAKKYREERQAAADEQRKAEQELTLELVNNEKERARLVLEFKLEEDKLTIARSTKTAKEKAKLVETIEAIHQQKLLDLDKEFQDKRETALLQFNQQFATTNLEKTKADFALQLEQYEKTSVALIGFYNQQLDDAKRAYEKQNTALEEDLKKKVITQEDYQNLLLINQQNYDKKVFAVGEESRAQNKKLQLKIAEDQLNFNKELLQKEYDEKFAFLEEQQDKQELIDLQGLKKERDLILDNKKSTQTEIEDAERAFAEGQRAIEEKRIIGRKELLLKQIEDEKKIRQNDVKERQRIELEALENTRYLFDTEEEYVKARDKVIADSAKEQVKITEEKNLELLQLYDEYYDNLKSKYKEDEFNYLDALNKKVSDFMKNNEDLIAQINATLQAAQSVVDAFQAFQDLKNQEAYEKNKKTSEDELALLTANAEAALAVTGTTEEQKQKIKEDYNKAVAQAEYKRALGEYNIAKEAFDNGKKLQIASAIISTIQGAVQAFTSLASIPVVGPILGGIAAAAALAAGYAQVATIRATTFSGTPPKDPSAALNQSGGGAGGGSGSKFAEGGLLMGRKHAEGGINTPYGELEGGEFIVNRDATASFLPMLEKINSMGSGSGAPNNLSATAEQGIIQPAPIIKTYVVASEVSSQQEANKRISDLARL